MIRKLSKIKKGILLLFFVCAGVLSSVWMIYHGYLIPNHRFIDSNSVLGCDVSHYQGEIDWPVLSAQNLSFAVIKATEGSTHVDPRFSKNWEDASKTNLKIGAYHFFSFESPGENQAKHFLATIGDQRGKLPPVVDVEFYGNYAQNKPDSVLIQQELYHFLDVIEKEYQIKPIIYTTKEAYDYFLKDSYTDYPLWIRSVLLYPNLDKDWIIWQYTNREILDGYSGSEKYIDMNVFHGSESQLEELLIP